MFKMKTILGLVITLFYFSSYAQVKTIDTIPFSLENRLLVFKARINDVELDFAFDTGATLGLSNSFIDTTSGLIVKSGAQTITDANLKKIKINNTVIKKMQIGSHQIENVKGATYDMEFLTCHQIYLLGMDVIGKLNWKIDFEHKKLLVSKTPFPTDDSLIEIPVSNPTYKPKTSLTINGQIFPNCLIDLGCTGSIEIPENSNLNTLFLQLTGSGNSLLALNSNMSVTGLGKADTVKTLLLDNIIIGPYNFKTVNCAVFEKTSFKIGVGFFSTQTNSFILNNTVGKYYIAPKLAPEILPLPLDARVSYQDGKLVITSLNLNKNSSSQMLTIGEIIKSIDGKKASDFNDNCQYLLEYYYTKKNSIQIEKLDGTVVIIKRAAFR